MIYIYPITRLIGLVAVSYACIIAGVVGLVWTFLDEPTLWKGVSIALSGGTILQFALFVAAHHFWRWVWSIFPMLNTAFFPDLNGNWKIRIDWQDNDRKGVVEAAAVIKQSLVRFSMEVAAPDSDSETYIAIPKKDPESGRPMIYYMYRVIPKNTKQIDRSPYDGAAILRVSNSGGDELGGNYFTSKFTKGYFHLTR